MLLFCIGRALAFLVAFIGLVVAIPDRGIAATVSYAFAGTWGSVTDFGGPGTPAIGGAFSGLVSVDTSLPDNCASASEGCFDALDGLTFLTAQHSYAATPASQLQILSLSGDPGSDAWAAFFPGERLPFTPGSIDELPTNSDEKLAMVLSLVDGTKATDSILADIIEYNGTSGLGRGALLIYAIYDASDNIVGGFRATGSVTSFQQVAPVPLPVGLPLLASALGGFVVVSFAKSLRSLRRG